MLFWAGYSAASSIYIICEPRDSLQIVYIGVKSNTKFELKTVVGFLVLTLNVNQTG